MGTRPTITVEERALPRPKREVEVEVAARMFYCFLTSWITADLRRSFRSPGITEIPQGDRDFDSGELFPLFSARRDVQTSPS